MERIFEGRNALSSYLLIITCIVYTCVSCSVPTRGLFNKRTPHEIYESHITDASLKATALGTLWFAAADKGLKQPVTIQLPYKETGYFAAEKPSAAGYLFAVRRGEKLSITVSTNPATGLIVFADLWLTVVNASPKLLEAADTLTHSITYEVNETATYLLRIQPELLRSVEYTVTIITGPSLAFPVPSEAHPNIGSFWGDSRDNGSRKHEGIDIFGKFHTPVVAAANGYVSSVREGGLGGKVVFMRPENKDYTLYYAHLDSQIAKQGKTIKEGDVVGLMGNTGNAKYTPTHLHFGIYTSDGAVDPLPFVDRTRVKPKDISAPLRALNNYVRNTKATEVFSQPAEHSATVEKVNTGTAMHVVAATTNWYKIELPGGSAGFIQSNAVTNTDKPLRKYATDSSKILLDDPNETAAAKHLILKGAVINVYGAYKNYYFVESGELKGWIKK